MRRISSAIIAVAILAACLNVLKPVPAASDDKVKPEPAWGEASDGFVVALSLDKDAYALHSDIPLHFSCSRLTDDWTQSGAASRVYKACRPAIELKDSSGAAVPLERGGDFALCEWGDKNGGPVTTLHIEKGAILTYERNLNKDCITDASGAQGGFPGKPGAYTATAVWHVIGDNFKEIATVRSKPVTFSIAGK